MPAGVRINLVLDPDDVAWFRDLAARSGLTLRQASARLRLAAGGDFRGHWWDTAPGIRELATHAAAVRRATSNPVVVDAAEAVGRAAAAIEARLHGGG